jgi:tripartite-type tricarboxylate transporter receptor subunit TctC
MGMLRIPHMQKTAWHPINDFSFIIGVTGYTFGFVVRADSPYKTFKDYIEAARKEPGKIDYGSTGTGTSPHLLMEEWRQRQGAAQPRPVQGQRRPDAGAAGRPRDGRQRRHRLGQVRRRRPDAPAGDLRRPRTKRWPNVPTAKELGYNVVSNSPYGLVGPRAWTRRS